MSRKGIAGRTRRPAVPTAWEWAIDDYLHAIAAAGQRDATLRLRRDHLHRMARGLGCAPDEVTADKLVAWFGAQTHWAAETRRGYRSAARGFFSWAYKAARVPVYLGDVLATVRQPQAVPRPAPDDAWGAALAAADARTMLMLRLAAEVGLRRAEVAQVHTRDVFVAGGSAQLVVHGKGGKQRIVPISTELAGLIRRGAAGHTAELAAYEWGRYGWLFLTAPAAT
ncbi:tyrosine-type recombinase/integrase [Mycobacterium avium]|uniref:tyrosine-type recombinase/integrase n=1 Tax=Mycobacterium avium TaxID=1764 RepID=UPI001CC46682|nr:tyrosine-type recombinase/integrase [Mycobacterium avium]